MFIDVAKLTEIAENESKVYEAGRKAEYDEFWDKFQQNGKRTDYQGGFYGVGWTNETFKPKYNIDCINGASMFVSTKITDLEAVLKEQGITFTTRNSLRMDSAFYWTKFTVVPEIDLTSATNVSRIFSESKNLHTIRKLIVNENHVLTSGFSECIALENLTIEGTIGRNGLDLHWSTKLSKASITSVITALSQTTNDLIVTFSGAAVDKAFETSPGANDGRYSQWWDEWTTYQPLDGEFRGNWIFDLV